MDARWKLTPQVKLSASWSFHSGAPVTPITGIARDGEGNAYGIEGAPGSARLPTYHRLDARIQRTNQTSWGRWSVYLEVANLYNRANVFQSAYNENYTGRKEYRMLPLLPTLGVSVEF
jgi:aminoglycoside phosphotransferase (APT) family kinase protein